MRGMALHSPFDRGILRPTEEVSVWKNTFLTKSSPKRSSGSLTENAETLGAVSARSPGTRQTPKRTTDRRHGSGIVMITRPCLLRFAREKAPRRKPRGSSIQFADYTISHRPGGHPWTKPDIFGVFQITTGFSGSTTCIRAFPCHLRMVLSSAFISCPICSQVRLWIYR